LSFIRSIADFTTSSSGSSSIGNKPGIHQFDLATSKIFRMPYKEGHQLMFRMELFNAFNTPQLGTPGSTLGTGTFGVVTSTAVDQRQKLEGTTMNQAK